jgi:hypothetical protein
MTTHLPVQPPPSAISPSPVDHVRRDVIDGVGKPAEGSEPPHRSEIGYEIAAS